MKVNLRRAKALQTSIYELIQSLPTNVSMTLGEFDDAAQRLNQAFEQFQHAYNSKSQLWQSYYSIRAAVAMANAQSGISTALAEQALGERLIAETQSLIHESAELKNLDVIQAQQNKLRNMSTNSAYRAFDSIHTGILPAEAVAKARENLALLRRQKQEIADRLLDLNVRTEIELDEQVLAVLQANNLV